MRFFLRLQIVFVVFFSISAFAKNYTLKKGDTLANVARKFYGEPVWGPKGTIQKIYKLNPWALTSPNLVEPGQAVVIEDEKQIGEEPAGHNIEPEVASMNTAKSSSAITKEDVALPPIEPMKKADPIAQNVQGKEEVLPEPTPVSESPAAGPAATSVSAQTSQTTEMSPADPTNSSAVKKKPKSYFIIAPTVSMGKISTSTDPAQTNYDLSSESSYGLRLGWDHWWTTLFSTNLTYNLKQLKSNAVNETTADTFATTVTTNSYDFALLNKMGRIGRFGFGATYGNHIFVEGFTSSPANPSIYSIYFWNPFLLGDFSLISSDLFDMNLGLKLAVLPADVGHDHDLKTGFEYSARLSITEKLGDSAFSFGINYLQNTQARVGTTATLTQTTADLGFMF